MAGMVWTFDATEDLINLRNDYREEFENALNTEHAAIWDGIATEINNHHPAQVTGRQCQVKWAALIRGYENSRRIRVGNPEGFPIRSPNRFDVAFYHLMRDEFWLPQGINDSLI
jgi:hypothetical protein